jgi:hypothetical protein
MLYSVSFLLTNGIESASLLELRWPCGRHYMAQVNVNRRRRQRVDFIVTAHRRGVHVGSECIVTLAPNLQLSLSPAFTPDCCLKLTVLNQHYSLVSYISILPIHYTLYSLITTHIPI